MHLPSFIHMLTVKHTLRYIKGAVNFHYRPIFKVLSVSMGFMMLIGQVVRIPVDQQRGIACSSNPTVSIKVLKSNRW